MKLKTDYNYNRGLRVLKKASKSFPNGSGVYKFIDSSESIIYIGKAKNLRKRISSYSIDNKQTRRIKTLISLTNKLEFIKTPTEIDSLILENNLIKKVKPPFNINRAALFAAVESIKDIKWLNKEIKHVNKWIKVFYKNFKFR